LIDPALKERLRYELHLNGFVVFRSFIPIDLVEAMREQIEPIILGEFAKYEEGSSQIVRGPARLAIDLAPYIKVLGGPLDDDRFRRNPVIEELVTDILGAWRYGVTKAECPFKGSEFMGWHPDTCERDFDGALRPVRLTFNIPLVDVNDANGPLEILPGSHRMEHGFDSRMIEEIPQIHTHRFLLRRGDAILRDGNALHRGTPNLVDRPRILLDQTYRAV